MDAKEFRNVGHQVVDLLADYLASIDQKPITPQVEPGNVHGLFDEPLPQRGIAAEDILKEVSHKLLPNCVHVSHPGYFGLITPTPTPAGISEISSLRPSTRIRAVMSLVLPRRKWSAGP